MMKTSLPTFAVMFVVLSATTAWAGGSIGWEVVQKQMAKEDAFMAKFVAKHFEVSPVGSGLRIGRHIEVDEDWEPFRLPPFEFTAKPKGEAGEPTLLLTLDVLEGDHWQVTIRQKPVED